MSLRTKIQKLPPNFKALFNCRVSYAQFGEDVFLSHLLGHSNQGVFVDVGCFHPIIYSNTYAFYRRGWRGLAIDPNPTLKTDWHRYRPGDKFLNFAIAKKPGRMTLLMNDRQAAMNLVLTDEQLASVGPTKHRAITCESRPLSEILDRNLTSPRIDLMSIDCEGMDLEVLETLDLDRYRPTVLAVEDMSLSAETPSAQYLHACGYECRGYIGLTKIYQDKSQTDRWRNFEVEFPTATSENNGGQGRSPIDNLK